MGLMMNKLDNLIEELELIEEIAKGKHSVSYNITRKEEYIMEHKTEWQATGEFYRRWRVERFMSKAEVARYIGVSDSTITKFEKGLPTKLARVCECGYKRIMNLWDIRMVLTNFKREVLDRC